MDYHAFLAQRPRAYLGRGLPRRRAVALSFDDGPGQATPALLTDGSVAENSISKTLAMRGVIVDVDELRAPTTSAYSAIAGRTDEVEGDDE